MAEQVTVTGLDELARKLKALPAEIAGKSGGPLRRAMRAAMREVAKEANRRAPRDSGRMARAVTVITGKPKHATEIVQVTVRRGRRRDDPKGAFYYGFVELGTVKQQAQPFLRPAIESKRTQVLDVFKAHLAKGIAAAERKVARGR